MGILTKITNDNSMHYNDNGYTVNCLKNVTKAFLIALLVHMNEFKITETKQTPPPKKCICDTSREIFAYRCCM